MVIFNKGMGRYRLIRFESDSKLHERVKMYTYRLAASPGRPIPYSDPIGSNIGFYRILQEFDGSDEIRVTESLWIPTVSNPIGSHVGFRRIRNADFLRVIIECS